MKPLSSETLALLTKKIDVAWRRAPDPVAFALALGTRFWAEMIPHMIADMARQPPPKPLKVSVIRADSDVDGEIE